MADLKGKQSLEAYDQLLTKGVGGKIYDGDNVEYFDPADKAPLSSNVIQVVPVQRTDVISESVAGESESSAWLSATITPKRNDSTILIAGKVMVSGTLGTMTGVLRRGGTLIAAGDSASSRARAHSQANKSSDALTVPIVLSGSDSPGVTSELTYTYHALNIAGSTHTFYMNRSEGDTNTFSRARSTSAMFLYEIAPSL